MINVSATPEASDGSATRSAAAAPFEPSPYLLRKRRSVRIIGALLGAPLAPVIVLLVGAVRLTSPGPGLYRQKRVGLNGAEFTIFKLRSMRQNAEAETGPTWARKKDSRVTPLGRLLRWTHLDELPQIINVIRGEMDFVGPRPERPEMVRQLLLTVPNYADRLRAMPGITGAAQVNLPPDQSVDCVRHKVLADRYYIRRANLWLDLRLVAATVIRSLGVRYESGARLLRVTLPESIRLQAAEGGYEAPGACGMPANPAAAVQIAPPHACGLSGYPGDTVADVTAETLAKVRAETLMVLESARPAEPNEDPVATDEAGVADGQVEMAGPPGLPR